MNPTISTLTSTVSSFIFFPYGHKYITLLFSRLRATRHLTEKYLTTHYSIFRSTTGKELYFREDKIAFADSANAGVCDDIML